MQRHHTLARTSSTAIVAVGAKGGADTPRVLATGLREISLGSAPGAERVGNIRHRGHVTHDHDLAATLQQGPDRLVG